MPTDKILITNDAGEQVEATAPVIISASRSTDIPAFYSKWFMNRIKDDFKSKEYYQKELENLEKRINRYSFAPPQIEQLH